MALFRSDSTCAGVVESEPLRVFQRIPCFLLDVTKQMMQFGSVLSREESASAGPGIVVLSRVRISDCQFVCVVVVAGIQLSSVLQIEDRITGLSIVRQQLSELV